MDLSLQSVNREGDKSSAAELNLFFLSQINFHGHRGFNLPLRSDGRLVQPLSPAFPSGLAGASLGDISDGYHQVDRPYMKGLLLRPASCPCDAIGLKPPATLHSEGGIHKERTADTDGTRN